MSRRTREPQQSNRASWTRSPLLAPHCRCHSQPALLPSQPVRRKQLIHTPREQVRRCPVHLTAIQTCTARALPGAVHAHIGACLGRLQPLSASSVLLSRTACPHMGSCCTGMPEAPRRASAEAPQQEPAARAGSTARPEEVAAFRMTRRRRSSSAAKAPFESEKAPINAVKAMDPAAPSSSPADASEDDDKPGELGLLRRPVLDHALYCPDSSAALFNYPAAGGQIMPGNY